LLFLHFVLFTTGLSIIWSSAILLSAISLYGIILDRKLWWKLKG
jgi:hypothetical protein